MKSAILPALCLLFVGAFLQKLQAQPKKDFPFRKIEGYRPRANAIYGKGFSMELFGTRETFENIFEKMPGQMKPEPLNFSKYTLLACYGNQTMTETFVSLDKIKASDGVLRVYFKVAYGKKLGKPMVPFGLYRFVHDQSLSGIDYYINNKLVQELRN